MTGITQEEVLTELDEIRRRLQYLSNPGRRFDPRGVERETRVATARVAVLRAMWEISGDHGLPRRGNQ